MEGSPTSLSFRHAWVNSLLEIVPSPLSVRTTNAYSVRGGVEAEAEALRLMQERIVV